MYNMKWDSSWTKVNKPVDRDRPFHRINSPSYNENRAPVSGDGYKCGCRSKKHYDPDWVDHLFGILSMFLVGLLPYIIRREVSERIMVAVPAWVPVERGEDNIPKKFWNKRKENEIEVEGVLSRSFQTWTDVPILQWHFWYDWNFHLVPAKGYKYLRGKGNDSVKKPISKDFDPDRPQRVVKHPGTMECEWDCGAFGDYSFEEPMFDTPSIFAPGPMFNQEFNQSEEIDWAWPMASQYIWISGRWIYDCGHANKQHLMRSELHPCKAIASSRWEAIKFDEHEHYVRALQFMLFVCRKGGYTDYDVINDIDYEFIVDLPEYSKSSSIDYTIGHSPEYPVNTLVIRPRLLVKLDYTSYANAFGVKADEKMADPEIELLPPRQKGGLPQQARIKFPLTKLGNNIETYALRVSLGWFDPTRSQYSQVKKIVVTFLEFRPIIVHDSLFEKAKLQIKIGINGRWFAMARENITEKFDRLSLNHRTTFYLHEDDFISINIHGMEQEPVGDVMLLPPNERTLKSESGKKFIWERDIDQYKDDDLASDVANKLAWEIFKESRSKSQNEPLGIIDPGYPRPEDKEERKQAKKDGDSPNPLQVKKLIELAPDGTYFGQLTARFTNEEDDLAELQYTHSKKDYFVSYRIQYYDQRI